MDFGWPDAPITGGINADDGFWEGLDDGELRMPRCGDCRAWRWPANWRCAECGSWDQEWVVVEPAGTVYSWTRSWMAFDRTTARGPDVPYVVILAEIPGAGDARVLGVLQGDEQRLEIGAPVAARVLPADARSLGYPSVGWELVPPATTPTTTPGSG